MPKVDYGAEPQRLYWFQLENLVAARRKFRRDRSVVWRKSFENLDPLRSRSFDDLLGATGAVKRPFRFAVLADSGEGGNSQYALLPWLRSLDLSFLILNGDAAYPAGRSKDFERGVFEPYRELGLPIWATPGNHEYYSKDKGQTFFQTFCRRAIGSAWDGMPQVPQPGTYWELRSRDLPVVVLGVDTGVKGNLDGKGVGKRRDTEQLEWLRSRLDRADADGKKAIVLFHFPSLVRGQHKKVPYGRLLRILSESPAVRLILCGHIHNLQIYEPRVFKRYLEEAQGLLRADSSPIDYVVAGGGGAYLAHPSKAEERYPSTTFPNRTQWRTYAKWAQKMVHGTGEGNSILARLASVAKTEAALGADGGRYLSFVVVEMGTDRVTAVPVTMESLEQVIDGVAGPKGVPVRDRRTRIQPNEVARIDQELASGGIQVWP